MRRELTSQTSIRLDTVLHAPLRPGLFIPAASSASAPKSKKPDLSTVLGPDSKLLPDERSDGIKGDYTSFAPIESIGRQMPFAQGASARYGRLPSICLRGRINGF